MKPSRSTYLTIRGLHYHIREWGDAQSPLVVMLHGWMDTSASFQFLVDSFDKPRRVVAPDWRGFGRTAHSGSDTYWFPDYLGDLDALLEHLAPTSPVALVGHSMGGNIACLYAGIRPGRVSRLVNLEGFGLPATDPDDAPARYARWLTELRSEAALPSYASLDGVVLRLRRNNPRLTDARARYLAPEWAELRDDGRWHVRGDPAHKRINPILYREPEALACWRRIEAPVLWLEAADSLSWQGKTVSGDGKLELERRMGMIPHLRKEVVPNAGHMLHHDQPELVAALVERHL